MPPIHGSHLSPTFLLLFLALPLFFHHPHLAPLSFAAASGSACPPCLCDCSLELPPSPECVNAELNVQPLDKYSAELLSEELKLQAAAAGKNQQRADAALLEVKRLSSQYQKEADKCNLGIQTCEEARENAEEALIKQKESTRIWEERARELGWKNR